MEKTSGWENFPLWPRKLKKQKKPLGVPQVLGRSNTHIDNYHSKTLIVKRTFNLALEGGNGFPVAL